MTRVPEKLKEDAIIEALLEIRFEHDELPEITLARLADLAQWDGYIKTRLPIADLPVQIRLSESGLRFQPVLQLVSADKLKTAKIGNNVISFHNDISYLGWKGGFRTELENMITSLFEKIPSTNINRIGLRYINALTRSKHNINSSDDIELSVQIGGKKIAFPFNINFRDESDASVIILSRIATPGFVQGPVPDDMSIYIDIDVFTPNGFLARTPDEAMTWVENARDKKNVAFFTLLPDHIIDALEEK